jgi:predicted alpha/beta-hydrolase family hydrolase
MRPLILFAHGAGASSGSDWMRTWARRLETIGEVVAFDYPYMRAGRKSPDRQPALVAAHAEALAQARALHGADRPVVLAGKSMGSRMGCHLTVERADTRVSALVCFGYPLRSGSSGALRDQVLRDLRTPILFVQGSKDTLCPLDDLAQARAQMTAPSELFVVPGGDHSLKVGVRELKAAGKTQEGQDAEVLAAVSAFVTRTVA